jgi:hypothetical protein
MKIKQLKSKNKELSALIKQDKFKFKECQRGNLKWEEYYAWRKQEVGSLYRNLSSDYRHAHIAYCLLRGRKYEQIEPMVKLGNEPSWSAIEFIMNEYREVEPVQCSEVMNG